MYPRRTSAKLKVYAAYTYLTVLYIITLIPYPGKRFAVLVYYPYFTQYYNLVCVLVQFHHVCQEIIACIEAFHHELQIEVNKHICELLLLDIRGDLHGASVLRETSVPGGKLKTLLSCYWKLCDIIHQTDDYLFLPVFAALATVFTRVLTYLYFSVVNSPYKMDIELSYVLFEGCYAFTYVFMFLTSSLGASTVSDTVAETGLVVCKLINQEIGTEIRQLIAASLMTYLVIIIQFQTNALLTSPTNTTAE